MPAPFLDRSPSRAAFARGGEDLERAGARLQHTARPRHDLTDHRGEPVPGGVDRLGENCGVVSGHDPHRLHRARRNAGGVGPRGAGSRGWPDAGREIEATLDAVRGAVEDIRE